MKTYQTYVRLALSEDYISSKPFTNMKWYPVTEHYGMCGRVVDDKGEAYLLDMDAVKLSPRWQVKVVEVDL
tara:strand:+ start:72574 stop:72786 length:213 start_codon:yes stop_codon:yes gene_type:complete